MIVSLEEHEEGAIMARSLVAAQAARHGLYARKVAAGRTDADRWEIYVGDQAGLWLGDVVHFKPEGWEFQPSTLMTLEPDPVQPANDFAGAVLHAVEFLATLQERDRS